MCAQSVLMCERDASVRMCQNGTTQYRDQMCAHSVLMCERDASVRSAVLGRDASLAPSHGMLRPNHEAPCFLSSLRWGRSWAFVRRKVKVGNLERGRAVSFYPLGNTSRLTTKRVESEPGAREAESVEKLRAREAALLYYFCRKWTTPQSMRVYEKKTAVVKNVCRCPLQGMENEQIGPQVQDPARKVPRKTAKTTPARPQNRSSSAGFRKTTETTENDEKRVKTTSHSSMNRIPGKPKTNRTGTRGLLCVKRVSIDPCERTKAFERSFSIGPWPTAVGPIVVDNDRAN